MSEKAVMISIQPKWVEKIASGEKTIEVRKNRPKIETPFKCYIYCTYGKANENYMLGKRGKVIGHFTCDRIIGYYPYGLRGFELRNEVLKNMCLSNKELNEYGKLDRVYGWHISDLKIYDKPRELSEFGQKCENASEIRCRDCLIRKGWNECCEVMCKPLKRPFQSWGYCESLGE